MTSQGREKDNTSIHAQRKAGGNTKSDFAKKEIS
jgi:hypothetical protein